jgi:regulator of sigma E protease
MSILIFIIILSVLIVVHELGHFLTAKKFGIRVDEFGLGYPPRAKKLFNWRGTDFTLNWLPFGGFVKIFGENPTEETQTNIDLTQNNAEGIQRSSASDWRESASNNFQRKNRGIQAVVLAGGVFFNFLFAWLLISIGFMTGLSAPVGMSLPVEDARIVVTTVLPGSPAAEAGIKSGDAILSVERGGEIAGTSPAEISDFIGISKESLTFTIDRGGTISSVAVEPQDGVIADRPAIGIAMDMVGTVQLSPLKALWHGMVVTLELTWLTAKALTVFIAQAVTGRADLAQVTGPVGIVAMVGDVAELGVSFLLTFTAIISINLALINLVPFPALDGGRLLFVGIEAIRRKPIPVKVFNMANTVGFALLIFLMILITVRDVRNIL